MKGDPLGYQMRELGWRRTLTPEQQAKVRAWLAAHPEAAEDWKTEASLSEALGRLADVPLSSNFTSRVMGAIERERNESERGLAFGTRWNWWSRLLPRLAFVAVILGAGLFSYRHFESTRRIEIARSVATVSEVASVPSASMLEDYEAIRALSQTPAADVELIKLMQ
jgi:anti-sigma factor RsiW